MTIPNVPTNLEQIINNSGLADKLGQLKSAMLQRAFLGIVGSSNPDSNDLSERNQRDRIILNSVGPAAASSAVEYAINVVRKQGKLREFSFNGSYVNNVEMIQNGDVDGCNDFSGVLRQFLLPRYAYLNFDNLVDPRHQVDLECGYPKFITPIMYRYMYDRDDMARRVVDIYPDESWGVDPVVYEDEDENTLTPFEEDWKALVDNYNILQYLYRLDRLAGVGHYGVLLLGVGDGQDLEKPVDEVELLAGMRGSVGKKQRPLLYMRPFDEYLSFIHQYETDPSSPRYGLPVYYNLVFLDMTIDAAGASIGTRLNRRVHWSRVIHVADNLGTSLVFGMPRQQPVFNRLLDLRKIKGGSSEMFWKGAFPGIAFELNPEYVADNPEFDEDKIRKDIANYTNGLDRFILGLGFTAKSLAPQVADPKQHVFVQMQAIAAHYGIPLRIFLGSEEGRLASSQDKLTWNQRLKRRLKMFVEPYILRNVIDRFIALGIMRAPKKNKYFVEWSDLNAPTDEDKANLSLKWTQALSQYVASGVIHLIPPMDYLTTILGLSPSNAKKIITAVESKGGFAKLLKVDPSQGAGVNGKRTNITKKDSNKERGARKKRNPDDKKIEGSE